MQNTKRVVIDARESGTSTGRYIDKLIEYLHLLELPVKIVVVTRPERIGFIKSIAPKFTVVETQYKEFSFGEQLGFRKLLESLKPDLVHFGMVQQPVWYKGRVVTTMHDLTTARFRNPDKNLVIFWVKQQVYKWVNKKAARKAVRIITPSEFVKKDVAAYARVPKDKIVVTYEAGDKISVAAEPMISLRGKQFILFVGRPTPHKNLPRLIAAFRELQTNHPDLLLVLTGKLDANYRRLQRAASKQGEGVFLTGFVSEGELRWLYEHASVYAFPSLSEGFGLPGLEAMAHGCPVASSSATCLPEIYKDAAVYFDPLNVLDMAETISRVLDDTRLRSSLVIKGSQLIKDYSWRRMATQTLDLYRAILGR